MNEQTCAVVVTYNRKSLLRECLRALLAQTRPVARILVINNVSTDGTLEMISTDFPTAEFPQIEVMTLSKNRGGAGGFHEGVKHAAARAAWIWLMDDDTIPTPTALAELFAARERLVAGGPPDLLASKVVWTDGSMHPMNIPRLKRDDLLESMCRATEQEALALRSASFVSLLFHSRFVESHGLPIAEYFIWNDDVEYTARILRDEFGVMVPASVAVHKTARKHTPGGPKFYYAIRNQLWMALHSNAWSRAERTKLLAGLLMSIGGFLRAEGCGVANLKVVSRALVDGLLRRP